MYKLRSVIAFSTLSNYQRCKNALEFLLRSFSSMKNFVEPTAVAYRAAMMQGIPLEELPMRVNFRGKPYKPVTLEESIQYLSSPEYQELYRGKPVWFYFRRNYKGHFPPKYPRKSCTRAHKLITSNPCPICRDEYLVIDHKACLKPYLTTDFFIRMWVFLSNFCTLFRLISWSPKSLDCAESNTSRCY
uniref:28S ribosomal protein S18b, mitochondrial n=1 Tax=Echinococcus canadensis TaxID=519352 RepID=A0A915EZJ2_9CEST